MENCLEVPNVPPPTAEEEAPSSTKEHKTKAGGRARKAYWPISKVYFAYLSIRYNSFHISLQLLAGHQQPCIFQLPLLSEAVQVRMDAGLPVIQTLHKPHHAAHPHRHISGWTGAELCAAWAYPASTVARTSGTTSGLCLLLLDDSHFRGRPRNTWNVMQHTGLLHSPHHPACGKIK